MDVTDSTGKGTVNQLKGTWKQNKSSKKVNADQPFSEQLWGSVTAHYFQSVVRQTPAALQGIVGLARAVLQEDGDGDSSGDDSAEGEVDARALMCKSLIALICHTDALTGFLLVSCRHRFTRTTH